MNDNKQSFIHSFTDTFKNLFTDVGPLLLIVLAPIIYGFLYPWPYADQVARQIPVAVVDYDNTSLSRQIIRYSMASPNLKITMANSVDEAKDLFWKGKIDGYLIIPANLKRDVLYQRDASVAIATSGSYALLNEGVSMGFAKAIGTLSVGISIKQLTSGHAKSLPQAYMTSNPLSLQVQSLYNPSQGYSSYVVPAVSILILHQTLLMGTALMLATLYERKSFYTTVKGWLARILAISLTAWLMTGFYFGWLFTFNDYTRGQNMVGATLLALVLIPTVAILGCLCALWIKNRERVLQVILFTSLPIYFISGFSWPAEGLPTFLRYIRWIFPSTAGINGSILYNQMGASTSEGLMYILNILVIGLVLLGLLLYLGCKKENSHTIENKEK